jgi:predicted ATP-grasp superfamily ATP-dependent carboligase
VSQRGSYFQRLAPGRGLSVLFLADGLRASVIGFNEQWTSPARDGLPFLYGGAVGSIGLPQRLTTEIGARLDALVAATGVIGLNGLDFLLEGDTWSVLELNPRPTATTDLYDPDYSEGLFELHRRACLGSLPEVPVPHRAARAHAVVYAAARWVVTADFPFPPWCRDLPVPGTQLAAGDPICTVHAEDSHPEAVVALVHVRKATLERSLAATAATINA